MQKMHTFVSCQFHCFLYSIILLLALRINKPYSLTLMLFLVKLMTMTFIININAKYENKVRIYSSRHINKSKTSSKLNTENTILC